MTTKEKQKILEIINSLENSGSCDFVKVECWRDCPLSANKNKTGLGCTSYAHRNVKEMGSKIFYGECHYEKERTFLLKKYLEDHEVDKKIKQLDLF